MRVFEETLDKHLLRKKPTHISSSWPLLHTQWCQHCACENSRVVLTKLLMKSFVSRAPSSPGTAGERCRAMTFQRSLQYRGRAAAVISLKSGQMVPASKRQKWGNDFQLVPTVQGFWQSCDGWKVMVPTIFGWWRPWLQMTGPLYLVDLPSLQIGRVYTMSLTGCLVWIIFIIFFYINS